MTKEEVFKTFADPWLCDGLIGASYDGPNENIYVAMDQYAKQQCIAFGEFLADYQTNDYEDYYHRADGNKSFREVKFLKMPELYTLYLQTSSK